MSKLPAGSIALTNPEAKLILIALRARCARLQNKLGHTDPEHIDAVKADITRTSVLLAKIDKAFPESNFHHTRPNEALRTRPSAYQQALCDHAQQMSEYILDPNS